MKYNSKSKLMLITLTIACLSAVSGVSLSEPTQSSSCPSGGGMGHEHMRYGKIAMLRTYFIIIGIVIISLSLQGCSIFPKKAAADTAEATEHTAYYSCGGCHGPKNVRVDFMSPKIIGQKKAYPVAKLRDFLDMKRINPKMNGVVAELPDQNIANFSDYYANFDPNKKTKIPAVLLTIHRSIQQNCNSANRPAITDSDTRTLFFQTY